MVPSPRFPALPLARRLLFKQMQCIALGGFASVALWTPMSLADSSLRANISDAELAKARALDWVPIEELTDEQKKKVPLTCCGAYIAPERHDADALLKPEDASLRATAVESQTEQQTRVTLSGGVNITQGNRSAFAETAHVDQESRETELSGSFQLREPGILVRADKAQMNMNTGEARMDNARFVLYETRIHGSADHLQRFGDNIISLEKSEISSCEPGTNSWSIQGSEIRIHQNEHYGTVENMRVNIKDLPVAYVPYMRFPVGKERLTGFLFPSIGYGRDNGLDVAAPFYWNLAPDYDLTITPRYLSARGSMLELDARHMFPLFDTEISGAYLANDRGGNPERLAANPTDVNYTGQDRWSGTFSQKGGRGQSWFTNINYTDVSDKDYFRDLSGGSVDSNRQGYVLQTAEAGYRSEHWNAGIKATEYRSLVATQTAYREQPRIHLDGAYHFFDDISLTLNNEYVSFIESRYWEAATSDIIFGDRASSDYRLMLDKNYTQGYIKPSIAVKTLNYSLRSPSLSDDKANPHFAVPQAGLDLGLFFERDTSFFSDGYTQTLEPRAFYFYSDYKNQDSLYGLNTANKYVNFDTSEPIFGYDQLFRTSRFSGGDRIDDANQVSFGLSSALVSQATGLERLRVGVGQIFYFDDRKVSVLDTRDPKSTDEQIQTAIENNHRRSSNLAAQLTGQIGDYTHINVDAAYNEQTRETDNARVAVHYLDEQYRIFNIAYFYSLKPLSSNPLLPVQTFSEPLNQIDVSVLWPIAGRWSLIARTNNDFKYGAELDTFAGFEYDDCCYDLRFLGRRWLRSSQTPKSLNEVRSKDYETGFFVEVQLKGLGSMSQKISGLLEKAVTGFTEREKSFAK